MYKRQAWGQPEAEKATFWVVGDSTVSAFNDSYYLPRVGYGEELDNYFNAKLCISDRHGCAHP